MARIDWRNRRRYIGAGVITAVFITPSAPPGIHREQPRPSFKVEQRHITPVDTTIRIHRYQPLPSFKIQQRHVKPTTVIPPIPISPGGFGPPGREELVFTGLETDEEIIMLLSAFIEVMNRER